MKQGFRTEMTTESIRKPLKGYRQLKGVSPAEDDIGPFYYAKDKRGFRCGFWVRDKNCNGLGTAHGGVLMSFADYAVTMTALNGVKENCATVSFNCNFIASAYKGDWVDAEAEVIKRTRTMCFLKGDLLVKESVIMTFQSVVKRLPKA